MADNKKEPLTKYLCFTKDFCLINTHISSEEFFHSLSTSSEKISHSFSMTMEKVKPNYETVGYGAAVTASLVLSGQPLLIIPVLIGLNNPLFPGLKLFTGTDSNKVLSFLSGEIAGVVTGFAAKAVLKDFTHPYAAVGLGVAAAGHCFKNEIYNACHDKDRVCGLVVNHAYKASDTVIEAAKEVYTQATQIGARIGSGLANSAYKAVAPFQYTNYGLVIKGAAVGATLTLLPAFDPLIKIGVGLTIAPLALSNNMAQTGSLFLGEAIGTAIAYSQPGALVSFVKGSLILSVCAGTAAVLYSNKEAIYNAAIDKAHELYDNTKTYFFPEEIKVAGTEADSTALDQNI